jgi:hypothetical protein
MSGPPGHAQFRAVTNHLHIVAVTLEPRLGAAIPAMRRRGAGMPLGNREQPGQSSIAARKWALQQPSGTLPPEPASAGSHGIYDTRGESARHSTGLTETSSMSSGCHGRDGRLRAHGGAQCEYADTAEICPNPINEPGVRLRFDQGRGGSGGGGHARISHAWMRSPRPRTKYRTHEQMPTPRDGHSCGDSPSPQTTPISGPFPGNCDTGGRVSGPLTGDIGRGPDTRAHGPGGTPPNSQGKSALSRCVVGWVESGYVKRGAHDTRHLSSCLVTPTTISRLFAGGRGGR